MYLRQGLFSFDFPPGCEVIECNEVYLSFHLPTISTEKHTSFVAVTPIVLTALRSNRGNSPWKYSKLKIVGGVSALH